MDYWILQASLKKFLIDYFLDDEVKQHPELLDWWRVHNVHKCDIKDGDIAYIWKAKTEPSVLPDCYKQWRERTGAPKKMAGIYAVACVKGCVRTGPLTGQELKRSEKYRIDERITSLTESASIVDIKYITNLVDGPLHEEKIWQQPSLFYEGTYLGGFKKSRQGRYSIKLTPQQGRIIWELIYGSSPDDAPCSKSP